MLCAVIQNNVVVEVANYTDEQIQDIMKIRQTVIDLTNSSPVPSVGWIFNGSTLVPPAGQDGKPSMIITRLAFRNRFNQAEKVALYTAAQAPTGLPIKIYLDDLASATFVDLSRPDTAYGLGVLATIGILTPTRVNEILNTIPTLNEIYKGV